MYQIEQALSHIDSATLSEKDKKTYLQVTAIQARLNNQFIEAKSVEEIPHANRFGVRKDVMVMDKGIKSLIKNDDVAISDSDRKILETNMKSVRKVTDYSPGWVLLIISLSLGLGTMIGWKRIVKTIGEKIGKEHLTYAQGASAEMVASATIGLSSFWGWPVSTTQVLSSAVAGSMVANRGVKNLQPATVRNILITWVLTLPVMIVLSGSLFLLLRNIF